MAQKQWEKAQRYLEIAAFGLLEETDFLATAYIRMAIVADKLKDKVATQDYISKVLRIQTELKKPELLSSKHWDTFQVLAGLKKPPAPAIPKDLQELKRYVTTYPEVENAWTLLITAESKGRTRDLRKTLAKAVQTHPRSVKIVTEALRFAATKESAMKATDLAEQLLALDTNAPLALEVLGNDMARAKKFTEAQGFYDKVKTSTLKETSGLRQQVKRSLERQAKDKLERLKEKDAAQKKAVQERLKKEKLQVSENELASSKPKEKVVTNSQVENKTAEAKRAEDRLTSGKKVKTKAVANPKKKMSEAKSNTTSAKRTERPKAKTAPSPMELAKAAVKSDSKDIAARYHLLELYLEEKDLTAAKKELRKLAALDKTSKDYAGFFAQYNYVKGKFKVNIKNIGKRKTLDDRSRYYLGMSYYKVRDYEKAQSLLEGLGSQWPELEATNRALKTEISKKREKTKSAKQSATQRESARKEAREALDEDRKTNEILQSGSLDERLVVFATLIKNNNWGLARRYIKRAFSEDPRNQDVVYYRARLHLKDAEYEKATTLFYNLSSNGYKQGEVYYYGGLAAHKNKDLSVANYLFRRAKIEGTTFTNEIDALLRLDKAQGGNISSRQISRSIKNLEARERSKANVDTEFSLMRLYAVTGNLVEFDQMKDKLTVQKLTPAQRDLLLAWNLFKFQRFKKALEVLEADDSAEAVFLRGYIYLRNGETHRSTPLLSSLKNNKDFPEVAQLQN